MAACAPMADDGPEAFPDGEAGEQAASACSGQQCATDLEDFASYVSNCCAKAAKLATEFGPPPHFPTDLPPSIVAHVCGDPLSHYVCRAIAATRVARDFLRILGL